MTFRQLKRMSASAPDEATADSRAGSRRSSSTLHHHHTPEINPLELMQADRARSGRPFACHMGKQCSTSCVLSSSSHEHISAMDQVIRSMLRFIGCWSSESLCTVEGGNHLCR